MSIWWGDFKNMQKIKIPWDFFWWQIKAEQKSAHGWDGFFQYFAISLSIRHSKTLSNVSIPLLYKHTLVIRFNRSVSANENSNSCNVSLLKITEIKNNELSIDTVDDETSSFATCSDAEQYGNIGCQVPKRGIQN